MSSSKCAVKVRNRSVSRSQNSCPIEQIHHNFFQAPPGYLFFAKSNKACTGQTAEMRKSDDHKPCPSADEQTADGLCSSAASSLAGTRLVCRRGASLPRRCKSVARPRAGKVRRAGTQRYGPAKLFCVRQPTPAESSLAPTGETSFQAPIAASADRFLVQEQK